MSTLIQIGSSLNILRRHEWADPYDYMAWAPYGSLESSPVWRITRLTISPSGGVIIGTALGAWTNRASLIYS